MTTQSDSIQDQALRRNVGLVLGMSFFSVFLVIMPVVVPFFHSRGLDMQDVFVLQAMFAVLVLVLEVPSGYCADLWGRKNALLVGAVFCGLGHTTLLFAEGFWHLAVFEACLAVAKSLVSGADLALAYDSQLAASRAAGEGIVSRLYAWRMAAEAAAAVVCSVILLFAGMSEVLMAQALVGWLPLLLAWWLVEPPRQNLSDTKHVENFRRVLRHIGSRGPVIRLTIAVWCLWGLTTYFAVWLLQKIWIAGELALHHFGYLWAGYMLLASISGRIALRLEARFGAPRLLLFCGLAPVIGYVGLAGNALASDGLVGGIVVATLFFAARGIGYVLLQDAFNSRMPSEFRATANSMLSFGAGLASAATGPLVGWSVDVWPLHVALWMLAVYAAVVCGALVLPLALLVRTSTRPAVG